jgi:hypothetical protein
LRLVRRSACERFLQLFRHPSLNRPPERAAPAARPRGLPASPSARLGKCASRGHIRARTSAAPAPRPAGSRPRYRCGRRERPAARASRL